jgi:quercetin dioxygenase-like cupin family protein
MSLDRRVIFKAAVVSAAIFLTAKLKAAVYPFGGSEQLQDLNQRRTTMSENPPAYPPLPPDDLKRNLTVAQIDQDKTLPHIGLVGDTYTITVTGAETVGKFCVIDMHIPPGGGPPPHRHDFEETFIILEGEMEATFRGTKSIVKAGDTISIPANAPHRFHNASSNATRLLCICSPAGQEEFFAAVGTPVATRTTPPPKLDEKEQTAFMKKVSELAPKYRTELLKEA